MLDKSIGIIAIQITTMVSTTLLRGDSPEFFVLFHLCRRAGSVKNRTTAGCF